MNIEKIFLNGNIINFLLSEGYLTNPDLYFAFFNKEYIYIIQNYFNINNITKFKNKIIQEIKLGNPFYKIIIEILQNGKYKNEATFCYSLDHLYSKQKNYKSFMKITTLILNIISFGKNINLFKKLFNLEEIKKNIEKTIKNNKTNNKNYDILNKYDLKIILLYLNLNLNDINFDKNKLKIILDLLNNFYKSIIENYNEKDPLTTYYLLEKEISNLFFSFQNNIEYSIEESNKNTNYIKEYVLKKLKEENYKTIGNIFK